MKEIYFYSPMEKYQKKINQGDQRQLLIFDSKEMLELVKSNNMLGTKLYMIGIGGCSPSMIREAAQLGHGECAFLFDNEDFAAKIINLLENSLHNQIHSLSLEIDKAHLVQAIIPDPQYFIGMKYNQSIIVNIVFNEMFPNEEVNIQFKFRLTNSQESFETNFTVHSDEAFEHQQFHRLAALKLISIIGESHPLKPIPVLSRSPLITYSELLHFLLESNILCSMTAFHCELNDNSSQLNCQQISYQKKQKTVQFESFNKVYYIKTYRNYNCQGAQQESSWCSRVCNFVKCQKKQTRQENYNQTERPVMLTEWQQINSQVHTRCNVSQQLLEVIREQQIDGRFKYDEKLLQLIKSDKNITNDSEMTLIILQWLEEHFGNRRECLKLIIQKGHEFLESQLIFI